jgi:hypothetical protein
MFDRSDTPRQPERVHEDMHGFREERSLVALDPVAKPGQRKSGRDEQQGDEPEPPNDEGRDAKREMAIMCEARLTG